MSGPARLRLAISSTVPLHVGSARLVLANWLLARRLGGRITLRVAAAGAAGEAAEAIRRDLRWLGLDWDGEHLQGADPDRYAAAAATLRDVGRLYPCFESEAELNAKRHRRAHEGRPATYDRAMLRLTAAQRQAAEAGGKRPYWRFLLSAAATAWHDLVLGRQAVDLAGLSDPVMIAADGTALPAFAGAVDDFADGITHVVRGQDLIAASAIERDLAAALGHDPDGIALAHLPAMADAAGARLARDSGNVSIQALRQRGVEASALVGYLARLGDGSAPRPGAAADLAAGFDPAALTRAAPRFDWRRLLGANRQALAQLSFAGVADRLPHGTTEAFWHAVRGSLDLLSEARGYWEVVAGTIIPPLIEGEAEFLRAALDLLPAEPWDAAVWTTWTEALKRRTGRAGNRLTLPLRLALTGEDKGPDLRALLPLIGRPRAAQRLAVAAH
jgi:glutamyl-tRNA synthetase